jgi:hypothetical protein
MANNYGDVALGLPKNWDRNAYEAQEWLLTTVGHVNGVADARLKEDPEKEHQFYWADPKDPHGRDLMLAYQRGYQFVHKDTWDKHDHLWGWDAEGRLYFGGLVLMARPKERWEIEEGRRRQLHDKERDAVERDVSSLPDGLLATESQDSMRPKRGPGRPRRESAAL